MLTLHVFASNMKSIAQLTRRIIHVQGVVFSFPSSLQKTFTQKFSDQKSESSALRTKLSEEIKGFMKAKDMAKVNALRTLQSQITYRDKENGTLISDAQILKLFSKVAKENEEVLQIMTTNNRPDIASKHQLILDTIKVYNAFASEKGIHLPEKKDKKSS